MTTKKIYVTRIFAAGGQEAWPTDHISKKPAETTRAQYIPTSALLALPLLSFRHFHAHARTVATNPRKKPPHTHTRCPTTNRTHVLPRPPPRAPARVGVTTSSNQTVPRRPNRRRAHRPRCALPARHPSARHRPYPTARRPPSPRNRSRAGLGSPPTTRSIVRCGGTGKSPGRREGSGNGSRGIKSAHSNSNSRFQCSSRNRNHRRRGVIPSR